MKVITTSCSCHFSWSYSCLKLNDAITQEHDVIDTEVYIQTVDVSAASPGHDIYIDDVTISNQPITDDIEGIYLLCGA